MSKRIMMTKTEIQNQYNKLEKLKREAIELDRAMTRACKNSSVDGIHDNVEFLELLIEGRMKAKEIHDLMKTIENTQLIEFAEMDDNCVNIDDILDINFVFAPDDEEEMTIQLVGGTGKSSQNKISINSPLGQAIYGRRIGETVFYEANNNKVKANLLRKVKTKRVMK